MLVAVNKIDKEGAQPDRVRTEMTQLGLQPEEWGGETSSSTSRPRRKQGLDDLLETILLRRRGRGAQGQPGHRGLRRGRSSPSSTRAAAPSSRCSSSAARCTSATRSSPARTGAACARCTTSTATASSRPARRARRDPRLRLASPRPASSCASSRTTARRARSPASARNRLKTEQLARRSGKRSRSRTIFEPAAGRAAGAQPRAQGRRRRLARGDRGRDREAAAVGDLGQRDPRRRRRHQRVRRDARRRLRRGRARLQRAARSATRARSPTARASRSAPTRSSTARSRSCATAMQGMLAPEEVEETVGTVEVRADLPRLEDRHDRRLATSPTAGSRAARKVRLVRDGTRRLRRRDRLAAPLQRRRPRGRVRLRVRHRARGLRRRQGRRRARGLRDAAGRARARVARWCGAARVRRRSCASTCTSPTPARLKGKRKRAQSLKAQLPQRFGAAVAETDHQDTVAARDARRGARRAAAAGAARSAADSVAALRSRRASRRACASSAGSRPGSDLRGH